MLRWLPCILLLLGGIQFAAAQSSRAEVIVALTTNDSTAYVGDSVVVNVVVLNAENSPAPEVTFPDGMSAQAQPRSEAQSQFITIVNGRQVRRTESRYTFPFIVTPSKTGRFDIGPARVTIDGVTYESDIIRMQVQEPQAREDLRLVIELDKATAYVGESVTLTATWMMRSNISNQFSFTLPQLPTAIEVYDLPSPSPSAQDIRAGRYAEFEFLGSTVLAERGVRVADGHEWTTYSFRKTIVPTAPGAFAIGPAYFRGAVEVGRRRNGIFGDESVHERAVVPSQQVNLRVLPLPTSERPDNFTGLVGAYRLTTRLSRTEMKVGDPITLSIRVSGPSPIVRARSLDLLATPELTRDFRVSPDDTTTRVDGGTLLIETTVRPLDERVNAFPELSFPYFDPELLEYQFATSRAIPVTVKETRIVTMDDAIGSDARTAHTLDSYTGGFAHIYSTDDVLRGSTFNLIAFVKTPLAIGVLATPPAVWFLSTTVLLIGRARSRRAAKSPHQRAGATARTAIRNANDASEIATALRAYLQARCGVAPTSSPEESGKAVAHFAPELEIPIQRLLQQLDEARFAGGDHEAVDAQQDEALTVLNALEAAQRRSR